MKGSAATISKTGFPRRAHRHSAGKALRIGKLRAEAEFPSTALGATPILRDIDAARMVD